MDRIDSNGSVNGLFHPGDPSAGQQATQLVDRWFNAVQEELLNVIEQANIEPDAEDWTQLYDAIFSIAEGAAGDGGGAVPTSRTLTAAGLITGGGDLAANRSFTVTKASAAEVLAGVRDDVAITPLGLQGGAGAQLLAGTGYKTIFGLLFQWGTATIAANGSTNVNLPTTFPSQCVFGDFAGGSQGTPDQDNNPEVVGLSASALTVFSSNDLTVAGRFFAIGF